MELRAGRWLRLGGEQQDRTQGCGRAWARGWCLLGHKHPGLNVCWWRGGHRAPWGCTSIMPRSSPSLPRFSLSLLGFSPSLPGFSPSLPGSSARSQQDLSQRSFL